MNYPAGRLLFRKMCQHHLWHFLAALSTQSLGWLYKQQSDGDWWISPLLSLAFAVWICRSGQDGSYPYITNILETSQKFLLTPGSSLLELLNYRFKTNKQTPHSFWTLWIFVWNKRIDIVQEQMIGAGGTGVRDGQSWCRKDDKDMESLQDTGRTSRSQKLEGSCSSTYQDWRGSLGETHYDMLWKPASVSEVQKRWPIGSQWPEPEWQSCMQP